MKNAKLNRGKWILKVYYLTKITKIKFLYVEYIYFIVKIHVNR